MHWTLAFRHLLVRPGRATVLLVGYALGVAVMIVLLSVGEAMLQQSRDVTLVGGGELTVLPEGVDVEALRTGGLTGMFFGIDRARFVTRQLLGGPRHAGVVRAVSPMLEGKRLELSIGDSAWIVRAGADLPDAASAVGAALDVIAGTWRNTPRDGQWATPTPQQLYDEMDRFHLPVGRDSTWGEWHYFNVVVSADEWWYITVLVGGDVRGDRWGGQLLVTHRRPGGRHDRLEQLVPLDAVAFDTTSADLTVGSVSVTQRDGRYRLRGTVGDARLDLDIAAAPNRYFPQVELRDDRVISGYVVPALIGSASGELCRTGRCSRLRDAPAYHDHNWGVWRGITWEWGAGRGTTLGVLYGGVIAADTGVGSGRAPFFLALVDSLGVRQVYRFDTVRRIGERPGPGVPGLAGPAGLEIVGRGRGDSVRLVVTISNVHASRSGTVGIDRTFMQMRGRWTLGGTAGGEVVADSGEGFFETWHRDR